MVLAAVEKGDGSRRLKLPRVKSLHCPSESLPTVGLSTNGVLLIEGANTNDWAWVSPMVQNGKSYYRTFGNVGSSPVDVWYDTISDQTQRASMNWDNYLFGGAGNDYILGSAGNDQIHGDAGYDKLYGGDGIDWMWGDGEADQMEGGWGNDALWGGGGDDTLSGQQNDDWLAGGEGRDTLYGGSGKDRFHYDAVDFRDFNASEGDQWWV